MLLGAAMTLSPVLYEYFVDELCKRQQLLCIEDIGSWVQFPDTLHEGYGHVAELMGKFLFCYKRSFYKVRLEKSEKQTGA